MPPMSNGPYEDDLPLRLAASALDQRYGAPRRARIGFADPHASLLPAANPAAATLTLSGNYAGYAAAIAASSFTSPHQYMAVLNPDTFPGNSINTELFTFFGNPASIVAVNTGTTANRRVTAKPISVGGSASRGAYSVEFLLVGSACEVLLGADTGRFVVYVDGERVTQRMQAGNAFVSNNVSLLKITPASSGVHVIRLDMTSTQSFLGVLTATTDTVAASPAPKGPRLVVIGDSYSNGEEASVYSADTYAYSLGRLLGVRDIQVKGIGGSGFCNPAAAVNGVDYQTRIVNDLGAADIVVLQGSVNDASGYTASDVTPAVTLACQTVRSQRPGAFIVVTGLLLPSGTLSSQRRTIHNAIKAGAAAAKASCDLFIDAFQKTDESPLNWFSGTGRAGTPGNIGNSDVMMHSDNVHPTQLGHDYIATRLASAINRTLDAA